jgi:hypothetical protein
LRTLLTATFVLSLIATAVPAQQSPAEALRTDPNVRQSQDPQPSAQGDRAPGAGFTDTQHQELATLLQKVWAQPVDLQGNPIAGGTSNLSDPPPTAADPATPAR